MKKKSNFSAALQKAQQIHTSLSNTPFTPKYPALFEDITHCYSLKETKKKISRPYPYNTLYYLTRGHSYYLGRTNTLIQLDGMFGVEIIRQGRYLEEEYFLKIHSDCMESIENTIRMIEVIETHGRLYFDSIQKFNGNRLQLQIKIDRKIDGIEEIAERHNVKILYRGKGSGTIEESTGEEFYSKMFIQLIGNTEKDLYLIRDKVYSLM